MQIVGVSTKVNIFIDLDGTILNIGDKYNRVFSLLRERYDLQDTNYWELRSNGIGFSDALLSLGISSGKIDEFRSDWALNIERSEILELDSLIDGVHRKLTLLKSRYNLVLCTARANSENLNAQLVKLGIIDLFNSMLLVQHGKSKSSAISSYYERNLLNKDPKDWIIGDTLEDIQAGITAGIKTCGVLTGLATATSFKSVHAIQICNSLEQFQPEA
jgi:phosphoglycolate phosphatase-like HAD superfamily hydrolase